MSSTGAYTTSLLRLHGKSTPGEKWQYGKKLNLQKQHRRFDSVANSNPTNMEVGHLISPLSHKAINSR